MIDSVRLLVAWTDPVSGRSRKYPTASGRQLPPRSEHFGHLEWSLWMRADVRMAAPEKTAALPGSNGIGLIETHW